MLITEDNELLFSVLFERDFSPQDAETLLGFKPNNGKHVCVSDTCVSNHHRGEQSIDAIERTFGELILKTLAGADNDGDKIQMLRPTLDTIISNGNDKDGFLLEFIFFVVIECAEQDVNDGRIFRKLVKSLPAGWQII
jgi:hypothetical protein